MNVPTKRQSSGERVNCCMTSLAQVRELVTKEIQLKKAVGVARLLGDAEHDERTDHPGNGSARSESGNLHVASALKLTSEIPSLLLTWTVPYALPLSSWSMPTRITVPSSFIAASGTIAMRKPHNLESKRKPMFFFSGGLLHVRITHYATICKN